MEDKILTDLISESNRQNLHIKNVVVRQHGHVIGRCDFVKEEPSLLWSATKSVTSIAMGIAIDEGRIALQDTVESILPEETKKYDGDGGQATVHDILCMGVGHAKCPIEKALVDHTEVKDICGMFLREALVYEPGTFFCYNNTATYMLSRIISAVTGESLLQYCDSKLFHPLGISRPKWESDELGITLGFSGLYLTATDLSKIGQMVLDGGRHEGAQIVSSAYLNEATSKQISTAHFSKNFATDDHKQGYGYQFWLNSYPGSYRMDGMYGQYVAILPDKDAVVTYISDEHARIINILELTWNTLIDKL